MTPEQLQFLVLEYMSKIPKASKEHIPINEPLRKWDGSKEDLITILRKMEGKSVNISTLHYLARPNSTLDNRTVRAKLTLQWHSYYAVLESSISSLNTPTDTLQSPELSVVPRKNMPTWKVAKIKWPHRDWVIYGLATILAIYMFCYEFPNSHIALFIKYIFNWLKTKLG